MNTTIRLLQMCEISSVPKLSPELFDILQLNEILLIIEQATDTFNYVRTEYSSRPENPIISLYTLIGE
jgi:hypothetical protein